MTKWMRQVRNVMCVAVLLAAAGECRSQAGPMTWNDLEQLPAGTHLVVITRIRLGCTLVKVTDAGIDCEQRYRSLARGRVREVREASGATGGLIGAALAGAYGGAVAAHNDGTPAQVIAGVGLGGLLGGCIGLLIGQSHGPLLYRPF